MAITIQGPDGASIDFPDGTQESEVNAAMAQAYPAPGGGVMGALKGASRALENNLPFVDRAVAAAKGGDYASNLATEQAKNAQFEKDNYWTNMAGGVASSFPLVPLSLAAAPAFGIGGLSGRVASSAVPLGAAGAVQGASNSPDLTNIPETAKDAAIGGVSSGLLGAAVPLAGAGIAKAVSPFAAPAERQAYVDILKQAGVNPTAGQITGNKTLGKLEAAAGDIPFGGGGAEVKREANSRAFTAALMEKAGAQPGQIATPENLASLHSDLGGQFDALGGRNSITVDPQLRAEIEKAVSGYHDITGMPAPGVAKTAEGLFQPLAAPRLVVAGRASDGTIKYGQPGQTHADLYEPGHGLDDPAISDLGFAEPGGPFMSRKEAADFVGDGEGTRTLNSGDKILDSERYNTSGEPATISGEKYNNVRSQLGKQAQSLRFSDPAQAQSYRDMQGALDDAMERSVTPEDAGAFGDLRGKYGNLASIEKAAGSAGSDAARGIISPAQMRTALASGNNRRAYARGVGDMAPLTNAANAVLTNFPQSGTAPRILAAHLLGAGVGGGVGYHEGGLPGAMAGIAAPALGARALMWKPVQSLLANQLMRGTAPRAGVDLAALAAALAARQQLPLQRNTE